MHLINQNVNISPLFAQVAVASIQQTSGSGLQRIHCSTKPTMKCKESVHFIIMKSTVSRFLAI